MVSKHYLAQLNIAKARDTLDSATMSGFVERLDEINCLAERSDGFIWRLQTESGDATSIAAFDDPMLIINMSVWRGLDALKDYVYRSDHVQLLKAKAQWFDKMAAVHQVLWWIPQGHVPSIEEAKARLEHLRSQGPSAEAFTFARPFLPPHE